ncbi:unnamed protein product, partial [Effrenium voratum]
RRIKVSTAQVVGKKVALPRGHVFMKFTHTTYQRYLLQCRRNYRKTFQEKVVEVLSRTRLPFRHVNDPLFPNLPPFLDQFTYAQERYRLYALQGPSQAAKTSFVKSLFKRPFVLTVQNATTLNLRDFKYGFHDCLILDNVNTLKFILDYRAILQSNLDTHVLGDSATNVYSYTIFLWGTPILITLEAGDEISFLKRKHLLTVEGNILMTPHVKHFDKLFSLLRLNLNLYCVNRLYSAMDSRGSKKPMQQMIKLFMISQMVSMTDALSTGDGDIDCDVDVDTEMAESEWLQANIMLDKLLRGSVCYQDGERQQIRMADMPKLTGRPMEGAGESLTDKIQRLKDEKVLAVQEPVTFQEHQIAREAREFIAGFATASWVKAMNYEHHVAPPTSALFEKYACVLQEHGGQLSSALSTSADGRDSARPGRAGRYMQLWCQRLRKTWGLRLGKLAGSAFLPVEEARAKAVSIFYQWVDFLHRQARVQDVQIEWVNLVQMRSPEGKVSREQWLRCLFDVSTRFMCGKRWKSAFVATGILGDRPAVSLEKGGLRVGSWWVLEVLRRGTFLENLVPRLQTAEELEELRGAIGLWRRIKVSTAQVVGKKVALPRGHVFMKFTHTTYQRYLLQCRRNYRKTFQEKVVEVLSRTRLPFRHVNDPLFPNLPPFLDQFTYAQERYRLYALQGPSQAAKTSFVKSLFKRPFVLTVQNATTLNLRDFKYGFHDCLILDNVNTLKFILDYRAILQSNLDTHVLGDSATNVYSYTIFLWGTPILITLDCDVDVDTEMAESEWLQANIMLDKLLRGSVCYQDGERQQIRMADMPKLELPN